MECPRWPNAAPTNQLLDPGVLSDEDEQLLKNPPRLFAIVASPEGNRPQHVIAWGHELPGQAVLTWHFTTGGQDLGGRDLVNRDMGMGGSEVAVFRSAQAALIMAELICPARLLWVR